MRPDERIHSARIIVEQPPVLVIEARSQPFRRRPHGQHPLHAVVLHQLWAQNLRCLAACHPASHIHLPKPVLRGHIALRKEQIVEVGGLNVRNAMLVPPHHDRCGQARRRHAAIELRQRGAHLMLQPHSTRDHSGCERQHQQKKKDQEHAQHRMPPPLHLQIRTASETHPGSLSQEQLVAGSLGRGAREAPRIPPGAAERVGASLLATPYWLHRARAAGGRDDPVHAQVDAHLAVVIHGVHDHEGDHRSPGGFPLWGHAGC